MLVKPVSFNKFDKVKKRLSFNKQKLLALAALIIGSIIFFRYAVLGIILYLAYTKIRPKFLRYAVMAAAAIIFIPNPISNALIYKKAGPASEQTQPAEQTIPKPEESALSTEPFPSVLITRIIDGDTVETADGAQIRLIGIDTPETGDCYFREASNRLKQLIANQRVELEKDVSETDKYGRQLRYIWKDGVMINEQMVKEGYANMYTFPPDVKYADKFEEAQADARVRNLGLWKACAASPAPSPKPSLSPSATPAPSPSYSTYMPAGSPKPSTPTTMACKYACDGPDMDCTDFSTQAEAQQFFDCCHFSRWNDPMHLDKANGRGNGRACDALP